MPEPTNKKLYAKAKAKYSDMKHSAYRSGLIVKAYKKMGGTYSGEKPKKKGLSRWFKEDWRTAMSELTPAQKKKAIAEKKATGKVKKYKK